MKHLTAPNKKQRKSSRKKNDEGKGYKFAISNAIAEMDEQGNRARIAHLRELRQKKG